MARVLHYRFRGIPEDRIERLEGQFADLAELRQWRAQPPWLATSRAPGLFEMEYLRHLRGEEGEQISAGGFYKMAGDEIDALVLTLFVRDLSAEYQARVMLRDDDNPLAKLRYLEFVRGMLPSGLRLEELLANRPIIKKVEGQAIMFYPPAFRPHQHTPSTFGQWGYSLCGLKAFAPNLIEAEQEALKILRGMRRLGR